MQYKYTKYCFIFKTIYNLLKLNYLRLRFKNIYLTNDLITFMQIIINKICYFCTK